MRIKLFILIFCSFSMLYGQSSRVTQSAMLLSVYELVSKKNYPQALKEINQILNEDSTIHNAIIFGGICHQKMNQCDSAIEFFEKAIRIKPEMVDAHFLKAKCEFQQGKYDNAIESIDKTLYYDNDYFRANILKARIYHEKGDYIKAEEVLLGVMKEKIYNIESRKLLSEYYLELGDTALALNVISQVLMIDPKDSSGLLFRINILYDLKLFESLLKDLNVYLEKKAGDPNLHFMRGISHLETGDTISALRDFNDALYYDDDYAKAYFFRAIVRDALHDKEGACSDLEEAEKREYLPIPELREKFCTLGPPQEEGIQNSNGKSLNEEAGQKQE